MFDPLISFVKRLWAGIVGLWHGLRALLSWRVPKPEEGGPEKYRKTRTAGRVFWRGGLLIFILLLIAWNAHFFWHAVGIRGYDLAYPKSVLTAPRAVSANETVSADGGTKSAETCDRSQIVDMQISLLDFMVNKNTWMPAMPQYKAGIFGIWEWADSPWFDNKASFQVGVLSAVKRTSIELADILGRVRGTSQEDVDLLDARSHVQYDAETWNFNPFDSQRAVLATRSSARSFRLAIESYGRYNQNLDDCKALFDARADNLFQLLDRVAKDVGSTVDILAKRSTGIKYDARSDTFVEGEGNDRGWFDFQADNLFMEASGKMYAYHGILQAARNDFTRVANSRDLNDVWDRMEAHFAEAAALSPLIVSNGREDGFLMPDHLSIMTEKILRARANVSELRDILKR
jgi:hypothetical protein